MDINKAKEFRNTLLQAGWIGQKLFSSVSTTIDRILILPKEENTRLVYENYIKSNAWPEFPPAPVFFVSLGLKPE